MAVAEHGDISTWEWKDTYALEDRDKFVKKYFLPYLNHVKFCSATSPNTGCFPDVTYKFMNGNNWYNRSTQPHPKIQLADGSLIEFFLFNNSAGLGMNIYIDINGHKKPNTVGRDLFTFGVYKQTSEFLPNGVNGDYDDTTNSFTKYTREEALERCKNSVGGECTAVIVQDGYKMNY